MTGRPVCAVPGCGETLGRWRGMASDLCSWHDGSVLYCICREPDFDGIECRVCFRAPRWAHQHYRERV